MLNDIIEAAKIGGTILRKYFREMKGSEIAKKGFKDYVTIADKESETAITDFLKRKFPDAGIYAEETGESIKRKNRFIIDPLDGTKNFIYGIPFFCVSIAYQENEQMKYGVIYDPVRDEMFSAERSKGAFLNDNRIFVSERKSISESMIVTGFPPTAYSLVDKYILMLKNAILNSNAVRRLGSAALDLAYVGCGRLDGDFEFRLNPWDVAAGWIIIEEAGGVITDTEGENNVLKGNIVAGNKFIHSEILEVIKSIGSLSI